ncbi:hypothetical protein KCP69_11495 [Salmonella enterica subsp. enterica]|nr:hypothetical protein KCP69_11495 [Salmonella enterica subsp. enterica]
MIRCGTAEVTRCRFRSHQSMGMYCVPICKSGINSTWCPRNHHGDQRYGNSRGDGRTTYCLVVMN